MYNCSILLTQFLLRARKGINYLLNHITFLSPIGLIPFLSLDTLCQGDPFVDQPIGCCRSPATLHGAHATQGVAYPTSPGREQLGQGA